MASAGTTVAVVAEKPSMARDIARVLGATGRGAGTLSGNGYVVTWAIGHLVGLAEPHQIKPEWKRWRRDLLPMLPRSWPLVVLDQNRGQFEVARRLLTDPKIRGVVCATDAGREGELIFRYLYEAAGCSKPVRRLWISSLTDGAIRDGFRRLREAAHYDGLADAARGRSQADWLVGMNLSRAYGLALDQPLSVGRVQTPTLAMVVERELAIRDFVPEDYLEVVATFSPRDGASYQGRLCVEGKLEARRLPPGGEEAAALVARALAGEARIASLDRQVKRMPPPLLYDLTELQRHANRLYGFSAQRTLETAQALYERHKLLSYPRTGSRHLFTEVAATLPQVVAAIRADYDDRLAPGTGERALSRRFVDDGKVTDHHAIIPTAESPVGRALTSDERRIHDLVCRRLLAAWHGDFVWDATTVVTEILTPGDPAIVDRYHSAGAAVRDPGWKVLDVGGEARPPRPRAEGAGAASTDDDQSRQPLPSGLERGQPQRVLDAEAVKKRTRPPPRFTDATLLTAMETAGKALDDKELSDAMRECGLGTPATRAQIIETLLARKYLARRDKALEATDLGIGLVEAVDPEVKSPAMTGQWEARLKQIERGEGDLGTFMAGIERYVTDVIGRVPERLSGARERGPGNAPPPAGSASAAASNSPARAEAGRVASRGSAVGDAPARAQADRVASPGTARAGEAPVDSGGPRTGTGQGRVDSGARAGSRPAASVRTKPVRGARQRDVADLLRSVFGHAAFRPHQEEVCRAATAGQDLLLVMPTGAGKSLCYQLPVLARGGTGLVVSPLIALMEDQVAGLRALGLKAERIHSGRGREEARRVCGEYIDGELDYLFIAPERLGVAGFPELLARRPPSLIAIDEAHCISQWGHDFRPDYRLLGQRLPLLRGSGEPPPIVALTATATPVVQRDIVDQLGLGGRARTFIHGFRRENLAVEVLELPPGDRMKVARRLLADPERRPAILYAPTRKIAEQAAALLGREYPSAFYHAGMSASARDRAQTAFLSGKLQVVVATIAFGMGVDKSNVRTVIHLALPSSVEGYYQEIGRAGRDGEPARAVLLQSFADRRTHEFFHGRDYPDPQLLQRLYDALARHASGRSVSADALRARVGMRGDDLERALEKLWIHGGVEIGQDDELRCGVPGWREPYVAQRERRAEQLAQMGRLAEAHGCRMLHLVRHFGDREDSGEPCGLCDACVPQACVAARLLPPTTAELDALARIVRSLRSADRQPTGQLCKQTVGEDRREFERLMRGLARAGLVHLTQESFEKDGKVIEYQRAALTAEGRRPGPGTVERILLEAEEREPTRRGRTRGAATGTGGRTKRGGSRRESGRRARSREAAPADLGASASPQLVEQLRAWRLAEAKRRRVPAFCVLSNRALLALAEQRPGDEQALLDVPGIGPALIRTYGQKLIELCAPA